MKFWAYVLIVFGLLFGIQGVNDPYVGGYSANNNYLMLSAKNYLRFGIFNLHFLPTYFAGEILPTQPEYYLHHPILMFFVTIPAFAVFGFANWVTHVTPFIFVIISLIFFYLLIREVWNKQTALLSVAVVSVMPLLGFFWKYIFFEQITMCFMLMTLYFLIKYIHKKTHTYLFLFAGSSLLGILSDWGGAYLLMPLTLLLFSSYRKKLIKPVIIYTLIIIFGILFFVWLVNTFGNGVSEYVNNTVLERVAGNELFSLTHVWIRLFGITLSRIGVYFTPLAFIWFIIGLKKVTVPWKIKNDKQFILFTLFIIGTINIIFLPNVGWAYAYFLYYWLPFFGLTGALYFQRIKQNKAILIVSLILIVLWSGAVQWYKLQAVQKHQWKYDEAERINTLLIPYETVGVYHFPGDLLENYFFHPTKVISEIGNIPIIASCWDTCTTEEELFLSQIANYKNVYIRKAPEREDSGINVFYTKMRNFLRVGQL